jgi:type VI secretion system protein ImpL
MNRLWTYLINPRVLGVLGLAALVAFLFLGASTLKLAAVYAIAAIVLALFIWFVVWLVKKLRARRAARNLEAALEDDTAKAQKAAGKQNKAETNILRGRLLDAVKTIKTSKLGQTTGAAALYELPWYMVIGNPAAGKSTAIVKSGLKFPFADNNGSQIIQGIGGTRNCDWFFTSEGILLDTAGRYSVHEEDRQEWLDFLSLLKRHRSKAPINGILIAASLAELSQAKPEAAIQLAKNLRQRVQELTEKLEVFAPVYLVFTKADLIAGFAEFFEDSDRAERDKVWGATLPYDPQVKTDAVAQFDQHFDELHSGLKELAVARMSLHRGQALPPGVLTFPLEFAAMKPALRSFVTTLFEENPYQFRPVFRGFYFTSAVQEGTASNRASDRVAQRFALTPQAEHTTAMVVAENGLFLRDLFSRVIFADRNLVKQFASRHKLRARAFTFAGAVLLLALALGGWSWSYLGNRQLVANVRADLDKAVKLQQDRVDLASRLEALELLQDRIEQLQSYRKSRPLDIGLGLYQGEEIERKLRHEYFSGVRQVMLMPVSQSIEDFLGELNANASKLQPMTRTPESGAASVNVRTAQAGRFSEASAESVEDGYNALKTYLMLSDRQRAEPGHLTDQITRFWRGWLESNRGAMPRDQMIRSAERMITFSLANLQDADWPSVPNNLALVDQTRENLSRVVRGMPARERVYAEVKARAATRFAPVTVARIVGEPGKDSVAGSYAVSGAFTKEAWTEFVEPAFKKAATTELQSVDWVLKTAGRDDLSLEGSPEQIRKALTDLYKTEYVREWQRFMQGITIAEFSNFDGAVAHMNRLGDATNSPIKKLMTTLFEETSWDNPSLLNQRLEQTQRGFLEWFKQTILRQAPSSVEVKVDMTAGKAEIPVGPIGREFSALSRIMMARDATPALLTSYLQTLGMVRSKFNQVKVQGDPGPSARKMMASTLEGSNSELSEALKFVDEQMLLGMTDTARAALRPLLVRPLIQSFAVIVGPTETEVNRLWSAQVNEPFQRTLAGKYPFDTASKIEAAPQEIAKIFGPAGAIAKFSDEALGALVVRRGDSMTPRTWAEMGVRVRPEFAAGFASWVAPLEGAAGGGSGASAGSNGGGSGGAANDASASQTAFQILPQGSPGLMEYTIEIDGQVLRYRNTAPSWTNFVWPNATGAPGVRIVGVTNAGRTVEVFNEPGRFGLTRMFEVAQRKKLAGGINELSWTQNGQTVTLQLRVISQPGSPAPSTGTGRDGTAPTSAPVAATSFKGLKLPTLVVGADSPPTVADANVAPSSIVRPTSAVAAAASGASR